MAADKLESSGKPVEFNLILLKDGSELTDGQRLSDYDLKDESMVSVLIGKEKISKDLAEGLSIDETSESQGQKRPSYRELSHENKKLKTEMQKSKFGTANLVLLRDAKFTASGSSELYSGFHCPKEALPGRRFWMALTPRSGWWCVEFAEPMNVGRFEFETDKLAAPSSFSIMGGNYEVYSMTLNGT
jgi:hypothetical protein